MVQKRGNEKPMVIGWALSNQDESNIFVLPPNHTKPLPHVNECLGNWMKDSCSNVIEECGWLEPIIEIGFEPGLPFYCGSVDDHEDDGGADNDANEGADNDANEGADNDANEGPDNDANEGADEDENEDPVIHNEHLSNSKLTIIVDEVETIIEEEVSVEGADDGADDDADDSCDN